MHAVRTMLSYLKHINQGNSGKNNAIVADNDCRSAEGWKGKRDVFDFRFL